VEAGLQYSDPAVIKARLKGVVEEFRANLQDLDRRTTIPFNRKAEWGVDGRIMPDAPVYSTFIRRKQHLDLE
jgi:NAD(P)H dehydrogenase (quinone)